MMRRAGMVIVGALVAGSTLVAAERATFLLTDGERISGEVVFHTEARTNIRADKNEFNVKVSSGVEMPIPFAQVVAIDFAGGTPNGTELAALPSSGHLLTLRNGENRPGHLVDLIGGDTIRWRNAGGDEVNVPIAEARRIYLRADRVREVYNLPAATTPNAEAPAAVPAPIPAPANTAASRRGSQGTTVTVRGAVPWTDTGITVRRGQVVRFQVSGGPIYVNRTLAAGPDGVGAARGGLPVESALNGAIIGKVGNSEPFVIGSNTGDVRMNATGRLMIGINDDQFDDNSGSFQVIVSR